MFGISLAKDFLTSDKAPYVVTLFVAALSWTAIRTSDRLTNVPFVEYQIAPAKSTAGVIGIEIRLRNITFSARFECFMVTLVARSGGGMKLGESIDQQQRLLGTVFATFTAKRAKPQEWEIEVTGLSPGADIALFVPATGAGTPAVIVGPCAGRASEAGAADESKAEMEKGKAPPAVPVFLERSASTFFVEHELGILWGALGGWLFLLLPSMSVPWRRTRATSPQSPPVSEGGHDLPGSID